MSAACGGCCFSGYCVCFICECIEKARGSENRYIAEERGLLCIKKSGRSVLFVKIKPVLKYVLSVHGNRGLITTYSYYPQPQSKCYQQK